MTLPLSRKFVFLPNTTLKDVLDRVFELCKLFEAADVHCFVMFVMKSAPANVTGCGTKQIAKFLNANPDIGKAFSRFCVKFNTATVVQKVSSHSGANSETADVNASASQSQVKINSVHDHVGYIEDDRHEHAAQTCEELTDNKQLQTLLHTASLRCKLFDENGMHGFVMFAKKSSPAEVICCGTSHGAKFLVDHPDIGTEFRRYCTQFKNSQVDQKDTRQSEPNSVTNNVLESSSESLVKINNAQNSSCECTRNEAKTNGTWPDNVPHGEQDSDLQMSVLSSSVETTHTMDCHPENLETNESILEPPSDEETDEPTSVQCRVCSKRFKNRKTMINHYNGIHRKKRYPCKFCDKTFSFMNNLESHEKYHRFKEYFNLTAKRKTAEADEPTVNLPSGGRKDQEAIWKCSICMKIYATKDVLNEHVDRMHNRTRHPCKFCNKSYADKGDLTKHEQCHFRHYKCQHCNKKCKTLNLLKRHSFTCESVHAQNERYICDRCGIEVNSELKLLSHIRYTHFYKRPLSRSKDFKCAYCPAIFKRKYARCLHLRDNHAEIALADGSGYIKKCPICDKIIVHQFQYHMDQHNKIKRFQCTICGKHLATRTSWFAHMTRIHKIEALSCKYCSHRFIRLEEMELHMSSKHAQRIESEGNV